MRTFTPSSTRVHNELVFRGLFELTSGIANTPIAVENTVSDAHDIMLDWLDDLALHYTKRYFRELPGQDVDAATWDIFNINGFSSIIAQDVDRNRFALRTTTPDPTRNDRRWIINASTFIDAGVPLLDVQLHVNSLGPLGQFERRVPDIVARIAKDFPIKDDRVLTSTPWAVRDRDVHEFVGLLRSATRRLPILVLSEPAALDAATLAATLFGVALVVTLGNDATFTLSDILGRQWSVFGGAIRTYQAPFDVKIDPLHIHPLIMPWSILNHRDRDGAGPQAFARSLIDRIYRAEMASLAEIPIHDTLWLRRLLVDERPQPAAVPEQTQPVVDQPATRAPLLQSPLPDGAASALAAAAAPRAPDQDDTRLLREELQAANQRAEDARRKALEAQALADKYENDYYTLLGENDALKREKAMLQSEQHATLPTMDSVSLPGARELLAGLGALMQGVHGAISDIAQLERERDEALKQRYVLPAAELGATTAVPVLEFPTYNNAQGLEPYLEARFGARLRLHPRVLDSWKRGQYEDLSHLFDVLAFLANDYYELHHRAADEAERQAKFRERMEQLNLRDGAPISDSEFGKYRNEYEVVWNGTTRRVERHLRSPRFGNSMDPKRVLAIYYFWDDEFDATVVTGMPGHAPNRLS